MIEPRLMNKRLAHAVLLIGSLIALPVAAWADPWCTQWNNQEMCASVEDFQQFANRICLQAQAKENSTADESIRLNTDCQAARNLAHKAELANTAHGRAIAAQRKLNAMPR